MAGTAANSLNISSAGIVIFDGTSAFSGTTTSQYSVLTGGVGNAIWNVGPGNSGQILQSGGASAYPFYSTTTYPSANAINTILYASAANTMSALATSNDGVLITSNTGVPSWLAAGTTGQVLTATTGGAVSWASPATASITINGDTGSITGSTLKIFANQAAINSGSTVSFTNTGTTSTFNVSDSNNNTLIGKNSGNATVSGANNSAYGLQSLQNLSSGHENSMFGVNCGQHLTSGFSNCCLGVATFVTATTSSQNTLIGNNSGNLITTGTGNNCAFGFQTINQLQTGSFNCVAGYQAGTNYTSTESNNILLNNAGTLGESNVLRIGSGTGTGSQQLSEAFISGINGVTSANPLLVTTNSATDQMGVIATGNNGVLITSSTGVPTFLANGTTGQVLTATTGGPASWVTPANAFAYTNVTNAMSPYTVLSTDVYLSCDTSGGAISLLFPNAPTQNRLWIIKDRLGDASTSNISVTTVGGSVTIDGQTTYKITSNFGAINLLANGTPTYEVY